MTDGEIYATALVFSQLCLGAYIKAYVVEKAKNSATKTDIAEITDLTEKVKLQYQEILAKQNRAHIDLLEMRKAQTRFRFAAIDRRLEAHQQTYAHWKKIIRAIHGGGMVDVVRNCGTWLDNNSLYLDPKARLAFRLVYALAPLLKNYDEAAQSALDRAHAQETRNISIKTIFDAGDVIMAAVALPPLSREEKEFEFSNDAAFVTAQPGQHGTI